MNKPKALDTDKLKQMLYELRNLQGEKNQRKIAEANAYYAGYMDALQSCENALACSKYEYDFKTEPQSHE